MSLNSRPVSDVIFAFFGVSYTASLARAKIMPEDRFVDALFADERVERLIVADPYRNYAGVLRDRLKGVREPPFPATTRRSLYSPRRLRRTTPANPARTVARYERGLRNLAKRRGLERPALISADPLLAGFGRLEWAGPVTYYGWDDWSASKPHERWWPAYEEAYRRMRETGRRAVGVSQGIIDRVAPTGLAAVIPNGILPDEWREFGPAPEWLTELPGPRFGYAGALDSRVDVDLVAQVARAFPGGSVVIIGPLIDPPHFEPLRRIPNVTIAPAVGRAEVAAFIHALDACLIPHARNDLTRSMSPLKLFEYLAAGRPVAAVDLGPIAAVASPRVVLVGESEDFGAGAARALEIGPAPEEERQAFVAENTWERRFEHLLDLALAE